MKGMGGFDVSRLVKQAQEMQKQVARLQEELKERVVDGTAGGGMVVANVSGQQEILSLKIDPEVVNKDEISMLEDMVVAAVNQAMKKSKELAEKEMAKITGSLGIPGLPGIGV